MAEDLAVHVIASVEVRNDAPSPVYTQILFLYNKLNIASETPEF
jgi:hypothetical protein